MTLNAFWLIWVSLASDIILQHRGLGLGPGVVTLPSMYKSFPNCLTGPRRTNRRDIYIPAPPCCCEECDYAHCDDFHLYWKTSANGNAKSTKEHEAARLKMRRLCLRIVSSTALFYIETSCDHSHYQLALMKRLWSAVFDVHSYAAHAEAAVPPAVVRIKIRRPLIWIPRRGFRV